MGTRKIVIPCVFLNKVWMRENFCQLIDRLYATLLTTSVNEEGILRAQENSGYCTHESCAKSFVNTVRI